MPLARTPPKVIQQSQRQDTFSPSQAFLPQNPGVLHSPLPSSSGSAPVPRKDYLNSHDGMDIDREIVADTDNDGEENDEDDEVGPSTPPAQILRERTPARTPIHSPRALRRASVPPATLPNSDEINDMSSLETAVEAGPSTPRRAPKRKSRAKTTVDVLPDPVVPPIVTNADEEGYGKYYEALMRSLRVNAIDRGLGKWTYDHLRECLPLLDADMPEMMHATWENSSRTIRQETLKGANALLADYKTASALQLFAQAVEEARAWVIEHPEEGRPDAWRPDLTPYQITVATNLEVYDESWKKLREDYNEVTGDCNKRYASVQAKLAHLSMLDNGVSDGVVELGKTISVLDGFPSEDMLAWVEEIEGKLEGRAE